MKNYSRVILLFALTVCIIVSPGCSSSGGGGSKDDPPPAQVGAINNFYKLIEYDVSTEQSSSVNILFHVEDSEGGIVEGLLRENFEVLDDDLEISPTESEISINQTAVPYKIKTVLMIDNSPSSETHLAGFQDAAIKYIEAAETTLINTPTPGTTGNQYFKIYSFSDEHDEVMPDFSNDVAVITAAIRSIETTGGSTNLYGAVIEGLDQWSGGFDDGVTEEGILVVFSDGNDSQSNNLGLEDVFKVRDDITGVGEDTTRVKIDKQVITIGAAGDEIQADTLKQLGNAGFYYVNFGEALEVEFSDGEESLFFETSDFNTLADELINRSNDALYEIDYFANTFYRASYTSPKRGEGSHILKLKIIDNKNRDMDDGAEINADYDSTDFFTPREGIYINNVIPALNEDYYIDLSSIKDSSIRIRFNEYLNESLPEEKPETPNYNVESSCDETVMTFNQNDSDDPYSSWRFNILSNGLCEVTVTDENNTYANGEYFSQKFKIYITDYGTPGKGMTRYYKFAGDVTDSSQSAIGDANDSKEYSVNYITDRFGESNNAFKVGQNDYVTIPEVEGNTITVSMWYMFLSDADINTLLSSGDDGQNHHLTIQNSGSQVGFYNDNWFLVDYLFLPLNNYHIVLVKDGFNSKLYIHNSRNNYPDGPNVVQDSNDSFTNNSHPLTTIGNTSDSTHNEGSQGTIDDVRIYDRVLSESEIMSLFNEK